MYEAGQNPKPAVTKTQGSSYDVDRTVLLASDTDGVLANGSGGGPFTLTDANANFVADGVTDSDRVAVIDGSLAGNVGTYGIATGGVAPTVLTLDDDPGAGSPVSYEVFKTTQAVLEGGSDADVATTVLTDANATFVTNANIDPFGGDKLAVISGTSANVGVYTIANGGVTETTLTITAGDMGNSGVVGNVVYEVVDGKAGFALIDWSADFVAANVVYGDTVKLGSDGDPNLPNWTSGYYTVRGVSTTQLDISSDAGDSYGLSINNIYDVFTPGPANWHSEALLDIFNPIGVLLATVDLNTLVRPDGNTMGGVMTSGSGMVSGFVIGGDVEIAPNLVYEVAPADDVTRLWICGVTGDGSPATEDGLDLLVVDVTLSAGGAVAGVSYLGGIDDPDLVGGEWYTGADYNVDGFEPFNMWLAYNDVEFDAFGNAVYVGGRGDQDNRYTAMAAADVLLAVNTMILAAGLNGNAVVGTGARSLDMDYFGHGTDFGLAFDNSAEGIEGLPLRNYGSGSISTLVPPIIAEVIPDPDWAGVIGPYSEQLVLLQGTPPIIWSLLQGPGTAQVDQNGLVSNWTPTVGDIGATFDFNVQAQNTVGLDTEAWQVTVIDNRPPLVSSDPPHNTTFAKIQNNCIWLTFDTPPVLTGGNELLVRTIGTTMGPDLGGLFTCSIEPDGVTLKAKENVVQLVNTTWYRFEPNLLVAAPFAVDVCTLYGNANNDTLTFTTDYGAVKAKIPTFSTDIREDINGDGIVFTTDYGFIKSFIPTFLPAKPAG